MLAGAVEPAASADDDRRRPSSRCKPYPGWCRRRPRFPAGRSRCSGYPRRAVGSGWVLAPRVTPPDTCDMRATRARDPRRRSDRQPRRRRLGLSAARRAHDARGTRGREQAPRPSPGASVCPRAVQADHAPDRCPRHRPASPPRPSGAVGARAHPSSQAGRSQAGRTRRRSARRSAHHSVPSPPIHFHRPLARRLCLRRPIAGGREIQPGAVQVLLLRVHAVDLARAPSQERHAIATAVIARPPRSPTHAGGRKPRRGDTRLPAACARMDIAEPSSVGSTAGVPGNAPMSGGSRYS